MVIYEVSLDCKERINREFLDKVKLLAYLAYGEILDYEGELERNILYKENIVFNELYDGFRDRINKYEFEHNNYDAGIYEPFMIDDTTFGFTIYEGSITDKDMMMLLIEVKKIIGMDCDIHMTKIDNLNAESRMETIKSFYNKDALVKVRSKDEV